jgi:hypothetical protein
VKTFGTDGILVHCVLFLSLRRALGDILIHPTQPAGFCQSFYQQAQIRLEGLQGRHAAVEGGASPSIKSCTSSTPLRRPSVLTMLYSSKAPCLSEATGASPKGGGKIHVAHAVLHPRRQQCRSLRHERQKAFRLGAFYQGLHHAALRVVPPRSARHAARAQAPFLPRWKIKGHRQVDRIILHRDKSTSELRRADNGATATAPRRWK